MAISAAETQARQATRTRRSRRALYVALAVAALVVTAAAVGLRLFFVSLSTGERGEMLAFVNGPVEIPEAWAPSSLPTDLEALLVRFQETSPRGRGWWMGRGQWNMAPAAGNLTGEDWARLEELREVRRPAEEAFAALSAHPEYARHNLFALRGAAGFPYEGARALRGLRRWLPFNARMDLRAGRWADVCRDAILYYRAAVLPPPVSLSERISANLWPDPPMEETLAELARQCTDEHLLRTTLLELAPLCPSATQTDVSRMLTEELVAYAFSVAPASSTTLLPVGMTGRDLLRNYLAAWDSEPGGAPSDSLSRRWDNWREKGLSNLNMGDGQMFAVYTTELLGLRSRSEDLLYWRLRRYVEDSLQEERKTLAYRRAAFDLARLALAARIEELGGRPRPTLAAKLAPRYFPAPLTDPWSGRPYRFNASRGSFYSVGPDGRDDGGAEFREPGPSTPTGDFALGARPASLLSPVFAGPGGRPRF